MRASCRPRGRIHRAAAWIGWFMLAAQEPERLTEKCARGHVTGRVIKGQAIRGAISGDKIPE